jgi:glycosyltransferase involved in cell wall biosynthesis
VSAARRLLALEPYYGGSHRAFLDGLLARLGWEADLLTLPARKWKWRMSGAAVTLAEEARRLHAGGARWDAVFASTFVNLPEFLGLAREAVAGVPAIVYFHENQLAYPNRYTEEWDFQFPLINMKSALAAGACVFNSAYNLESFLSEIPRFLKRFPDHVPAGVPERIRKRSQVLPPAFDRRALDAAPLVRGDRPRIVWPHRWDHDKGPHAFFAAVERLAGQGLEFEVAVAGEEHDDVRAEFERLRVVLGDRLVTLGGLTRREEYAAMLRSCDVAVSTAEHEFFGLAMVESAYAGCFPFVPDRLAYPEVYPPECRYGSGEEFVARLGSLLADARPEPAACREVGEAFTFEALMPRYRELFERVAAG